jgi:uncharacterized protein (DUF2235 family)
MSTGATDDAVERDPDAGEIVTRKTIILFSDGTGNQSGKLNKTNVWRMYQAVDLGVPQVRTHGVQIGRYDNGVGTSAFRLLAMIQGIFGWGLKRNILSLYLFLCRNYRKGDQICLFGFSRGAFTVRVLADLIDKQGIIPREYGGALDYLVRDAYRVYRRRQRPRMWPMRWLVPLMNRVVGAIRQVWRTARFQHRYDPSKYHMNAEIDFLGVWDTVGAYGGPILEIVRAIDDWITQISFTDTKLPGCVRVARHALALDDERDSFQPLPWGEEKVSRERLEQVWFAGMHSDVGGGYPDDSLSYVSFVWMLDEARACAQIRFRPDREEEARLQADSFGPIHQSRSGPAAYYRYQPRKISALMWPRVRGSESLVDPEKPVGQGMRRPALIHDSVFRRVLWGTDGYAPVSISRDYEIVEDRSARPGLRLPARHRKRLSDPHWQRHHAAAQEKVWDDVWKRRIVYFMIVASTLGLIASPALINWLHWSSDRVVTDVLRLPFVWLKNLDLGVVDWWLNAFANYPALPIILTILIVVLFRVSSILEKSLRAHCRSNWRAPMRTAGARPRARSLLGRVRTDRIYQRLLGILRWQLIPSAFGIAMLVILLSLFASALTMVRLTWSEHNDMFCPQSRTVATPGTPFRMTTDNPCNQSGQTVQDGQKYEITLVIPAGETWRDGSVDVDPQGRAAGTLMSLGLDRLFLGMRRHYHAKWMQPLAYIVPSDSSEATSTRPLIFEEQPSDPARPGAKVYRALFTASRTGHLAFAVNEAIPPWPFPHDFFYRGMAVHNSGSACVRITGRETGPLPAPAC